MGPIAPQIRCYLPLSPALLQTLADTASLPADLVAFVVTESVRRSDPGGDEESWEFAALQDAAAYCQQEGQPVIVAAADVARDTIQDSDPTGSRVSIRAAVTLPRVASFHVGDDLVGDVAAVSGDTDLIELSWYDATELAAVRSLLG